MRDIVLKIRFQEIEYILVGDSLSDGGAIATQEQFENGKCSFAHLWADGNIVRYGQLIGNVGEIEITGNYEPNDEIATHVLTGLFNDKSWPWNKD